MQGRVVDQNPNPLKNVWVALTVGASTAAAIDKVDWKDRITVFSDALERAVSEYLQDGPDELLIGYQLPEGWYDLEVADGVHLDQYGENFHPEVF